MSMARLGRVLREPASNLHLIGIAALGVALLLLAEALLLPDRGIFPLVALPTAIAGLLGLIALARGELRDLDGKVASFLGELGLDARFRHHDVLSVLVYGAGVIGCAGAYAWIALTPSAVPAGDESFRWGLIDKRPLVFAYLAAAGFVAFHWFAVVVLFEPGRPRRPAGAPAAVGWPLRLAGALSVALLAYGLLGIPLLQVTEPLVDARALADFHELHSHVHLSALEQIRLGALPYVEAKTQYGLGNQLLMYALTNAVHFSSHGFHLAVTLLSVLCIVVFFVVVQQLLGTGWALLGIAGWLLWPCPSDAVAVVPGWATLTRWLAIPILALVLAHLLLNARANRPSASAMLAAGVIWGIGGFLSQENLTGGALVLIVSFGLFGAASGLRLPDLARASGIFVASGVVVLVVLVASSVGIDNTLEVFRLAGDKSRLVMAGVSNSFWSDDVALNVGFRTRDGWREDVVVARGALRGVVLTYGMAVLLPVLIGIVAYTLARRWSGLKERHRAFVGKFAGVVVGAYVLHFFTLLRSDITHLAAPSFLLPLALLMLPVFAWRGLKPGIGRNALLLVSAGLIVEAAAAATGDFGRRIDRLGDGWRGQAEALATYEALREARGRTAGFADRYSPIAGHQARFRAHPDFDETQELLALLQERSAGRPVELAYYQPTNGLIASPELFYFLGGFRSLSGMTSHQTNIWLRSEEDAWIEQVSVAESGCVFFQPGASGKLYDAWRKSARIDRIEGRRVYGLLACRG